MSDTYSPPSMPPPSNSDKKLRIFAVVFFVAAVLFLGVIIGASGDSKPAANETTATVSVTNAPIAADPVQISTTLVVLTASASLRSSR